MSASEPDKTENPQPAKPKSASGDPRRHRGRRGGRGRRPGPASAPTPAAIPPPEETALAPLAEEAAPPAAPRPVAPPRPAIHQAAEPELQTSAVSQALDEVSQVVEALRKALDQMEEALELVELAERQKLADEQELDSLRRALRQLQRPRSQRPHDDEGRQS